MGMNLIPSVFQRLVPAPFPTQEHEVLAGQIQGVHITLASPEFAQLMLNKLLVWFKERDEVELVSQGLTQKAGQGYLLLEWRECAIDELFLAILREEEMVSDFSVYMRDLESLCL